MAICSTKVFPTWPTRPKNADAYLINGMCNFRTGPNDLPQRPLHLARALEDKLGKPVIGHDTALYWRIMKDLGIAPTTPQSQLLESLHA